MSSHCRVGVKVMSRRGQDGIRAPLRAVHGVFCQGMFEDLIAAVVGLALVVYLLYALVRPDRF